MLVRVVLVTFHYVLANTENIGVRMLIILTHSLLSVYVLAALVKRNSAYSFHLETNDFRPCLKVRKCL